MLATSWGKEEHVLYMFLYAMAAVNMPAQRERIGGGFILITGIDGIRYAVRPTERRRDP
jgi:hypothetical protein